MSKNIKVVAYLRVSDISQINGTGFERQAEAIKTFAKSRNYSIIHVYRESHLKLLALMVLIWGILDITPIKRERHELDRITQARDRVHL